MAEDLGGGVLFVEQHVVARARGRRPGLRASHGQLVLEGAAADLAQDRALVEAGYLGSAV